MRHFYLLILFLVILAWSGCGESETPLKISLYEPPASEIPENQTGRNDYIRLALASVISPEESYKYYDKMIEYISEKLHRPIKLIQRESYREINDLLKLGKIDLAFVCSGAYTLGQAEFGMELLVVPEVNGEPVYYSYIIVPSASPADNLGDLKGTSFAFTDPLSNSGCLSPRYLLLTRLNETSNTFFKEVQFTYSHDTSIKAVAQGKVDGAAVDSLVYGYLKKINPELINKTKIIDVSEPYGIPPVVVAPNVNPELKKHLQDIFLEMNDDSLGREILEQLMIDKFVPGQDVLYDSIRRMEKTLK